jgi:polyhydroxybutyrate depolymerase
MSSLLARRCWSLVSAALLVVVPACGSSVNPSLASVPSVDAGADAPARVDAKSGDARVASAGCGVIPTQAFAKYVQYNEVVSGVASEYLPTYANRIYYVRLPRTYDPSRAYPTVFIGPGCGETGQSPIPFQDGSGEDAILVGLNGINNCFNKDAADSPELQYFDATAAAVEKDFCVDTARLFVTGFSSGGWLTSFLGCARGNLLRGQASVAGGLPPAPACTGPIAAMYVSDTNDVSNPTAQVMKGLSRVLTANGCGAETLPYDAGVPSPCVEYQGCMPGYPVVWCVTMGLGHNDQSGSGLSTVGFWNFWKSLP